MTDLPMWSIKFCSLLPTSRLIKMTSSLAVINKVHWCVAIVLSVCLINFTRLSKLFTTLRQLSIPFSLPFKPPQPTLQATSVYPSNHLSLPFKPPRSTLQTTSIYPSSHLNLPFKPPQPTLQTTSVYLLFLIIRLWVQHFWLLRVALLSVLCLVCL